MGFIDGKPAGGAPIGEAEGSHGGSVHNPSHTGRPTGLEHVARPDDMAALIRRGVLPWPHCRGGVIRKLDAIHGWGERRRIEDVAHGVLDREAFEAYQVARGAMEGAHVVALLGQRPAQRRADKPRGARDED